MRSSKSRSRSKSNRPRTIGNIINRVFDSSGPEGKVRGTPQQIIDKYMILARDAQLSNDRVATENFQQHAEHYTRMLGEAMREMADQDQRRDGGNSGQSGHQNNGQPSGGQPSSGQSNSGQMAHQNGNSYTQGNRDRSQRDDAADAPPPRGAAVIELSDDGDDSGLVETPETRHRAEAARNESAERPAQAERKDRGDRQDRRNDRPRFPQADRRDGRKPVPAEEAQTTPGQGVQTQPARPDAAQSETAENAVPQAAPEPLAPMMPSFATPPEDPPKKAAPAEKPATVRRPRAPRKPKAPDGNPDDGPAEAAE